MDKDIKNCRICGSTKLLEILNLGSQVLTGIFPATKETLIASEELILAKCSDCDLVQMKNTPPLSVMYGENYGYRSSLNQSMINHLRISLNKIISKVTLEANDLVIDIGCNDGTLLGFYPDNLNLKLLGVDPVGKYFKHYYKKNIILIDDFFPSSKIDHLKQDQKAKIITSFSCFYDLENPVAFAESIKDHLDINGIWTFEQSYLPRMIEQVSYDTICHEHLEYYCLKQLKLIVEKAGMKIVDVEFNDVNGGSVCITAAHFNSIHIEPVDKIHTILQNEEALGCYTTKYYHNFANQVHKHREELISLLKNLSIQGKVITGLGASTKGNVVLQFCDIKDDILQCIGEVNELKFGHFTPGTRIPIVSESQANALNPDFKLILPWHFRETFIAREQSYIKNGGKLIFPLPEIEIYPS